MSVAVVIETLSPTCVSGGRVGRSDVVDIDVERHPDTRLPWIRGRTLKGLLREEVEMLLPAIEAKAGDAYAAWQAAFERLFGQEAKRSSLPGCFPDLTLPPALDNAEIVADLEPTLTEVRRQTRIDRKTRAAGDHSLRALRAVRPGLAFAGLLTVPHSLDGREKALLAAGARALRRMGLRRNRGLGRVRVGWFEDAVDVTEAWLSPLMSILEGKKAPINVVDPVASWPAAEARAGGTVRFRVKLRSDVVVGAPGGDPNTKVSSSYIPGSQLLGAMAAVYLRNTPDHWPDGTAAHEDVLFRRLFLDQEGCRWRSAYLVCNDETTMPAPASLVRSKELPTQGRIVLTADDVPTEGGSTLERTIGGFVQVDASEPSMLTVIDASKRRQRHHQRDRDAGRPVDGGIFAYEALAAGQVFEASVWCPDAQTHGWVDSVIDGAVVHLGRSRSATYGAAELQAIKGPAPAAPTVDEDEVTVAFLASDVIPPPTVGRTLVESFCDALSAAVGGEGITSEEIEAQVVHTTRVGGEVGVWGMPRPSERALVQGSVFVFSEGAEAKLRASRETLFERGVGLRRSEGFGRVELLALPESGLTLESSRPDTFEPPSAHLSNAVVRTVHQRVFAVRAWRQVRKRALQHSSDRRVLTKSRLGRLRTLARGAHDATALRAELKQLNAPLRDAMKGVKIEGNRSLSHHLDLVLSEDPFVVIAPNLNEAFRGLDAERDTDMQNDWKDHLRWSLQRLYIDTLLQQLRRNL